MKDGYVVVEKISIPSDFGSINCKLDSDRPIQVQVSGLLVTEPIRFFPVTDNNETLKAAHKIWHFSYAVTLFLMN